MFTGASPEPGLAVILGGGCGLGRRWAAQRAERPPRSLQSVDFEAVAVTLKELVRYALSRNANNHSWLIVQADIYFGERRGTRHRGPRLHP